MKLKNLKYSLLLALAVLIVGCNNNPVFGPQDKIIKSQTKWLVDNKTENKIAKVYYKEYDRMGNTIMEELYSGSGHLLVRKDISMIGNNKIENVTEFGKNGEIIRSRNIYTFNEQGNVSERLTISEDGDTTAIIKFSYYDNGKIKSEFAFDINGDLVKQTSYMYNYDENGYITGRLVNDDLDASFNKRDSIVYHLNLRQVEYIVFDTDGNKEIIYTYYYGNAGNILKEIQTDNAGIIQRKYLYEYTFF